MEIEILKDEEFVPIENSKYLISNKGRVYSLMKNKLMSAQLISYRYLGFSLRINNKYKTYYLHRLLATYFIENPYGLTSVNHKNGITTDNALNNLEWCTQSENVKHAYDSGLVDMNKLANRKKRAYVKDHETASGNDGSVTNPYKKSIPQWRAWNRGWNDAMEYIKKNTNHNH